MRILQSLSGGVEPKLDVEGYFKKLESGAVHIDEGLRVCGGRIARAVYAVRSKRSIAHTGEVEPNEADLRFSFAGAQWLLAELLRVCGGLSMREAALLVNASVGNAVGIVDETSSKVLLLADVSVTDEIILRLHHDYPATVALHDVLDSLDRRKPETVKRLLRKLWNDKLVEGSPDAGYRLTDKGLRAAAAVLERVGGS